ncbi:hypothetical protein HO133_007459 [Letharia lupina]|uniref:Phosphomevalonate kinase n=1 Tax=Letharia lupina TaxID=560253 RepID=A0A8H6FIS6_9LECA|nr:uncharacterized protein HO133_007459 [Letharia lupina]KAF6229343.1 hypothetical protein HO133_007459 [Letharia lupina]
MERPSVAFSAPGKVLLAGGYLVLDRDYTGFVFGLDARIHVHVQTLQTSPGLTLSEIIVKSPQFRDAEWRYGYRETEENGGIEVTQLKGHSTSSQSRNRFVETALAYALTYVSAVDSTRIGPASITILADRDYYSHSGSSGNDIPSTVDRFLDFNIPLHQAHKTGLGSSAALVTAFITAVVAHYAPLEVADASSMLEKLRLHNLAQAAHCAAQGKIGSGFDVAAAACGSCTYKRFSPSILEGLGDVGSKGFSTRLQSIVEDTDSSKKWDTVIDKKSAATVPKGLRLVMCDVDCGSETVGMVKNVLSWRKTKPEESVLLWQTLQKGNEDLALEFHNLASKPAGQAEDYEGLRTVILTIRSSIREMSTKSGVPIEPEVQTKLIDACCRLPGVVGGVVPGAGGYDAIVLLVEDKSTVIDGLHQFLDDYRVDADQGHGDSIGKVRLLGVKQEDRGVQAENSIIYDGWLK